jgi:hypothetical protein
MLQQLQRFSNIEIRYYVLTEGRTNMTYLCKFLFERTTITGQKVVLAAVYLRLNI